TAFALTIMMAPLGCGTKGGGVASPGTYDSILATQSTSGTEEQVLQERFLIWYVNVEMEVYEIAEAVEKINEMTKLHGGVVSSSSIDGEKEGEMTLRIPNEKLDAALEGLTTVGKVKELNKTSDDVTERLVDQQARLQSKKALRDRLNKLLERSNTVDEVLKVEEQLGRLQADIESMEAQLRSLQGMVQHATVRIELERKTILGPLGYVFKGLGWTVEKLFVIQN
ncbi:MAG: DUF4349 domain-containing protein, partial [Candidatus Sumerlaeia bacterium]|nr:DUF4349 domain-containing protein [Candidatus Sumerlaeia bacterium]